MISLETYTKLEEAALENQPFDHCIIDNFFDEETALKLEQEFPSFDSSLWYSYDSPLEVKKTMNFWDRFPPATYNAFWDLCSPMIAKCLGKKFHTTLEADIGLNGGGWHIHGSGGKLNVHLDYSIHPKINKQRKLNIIIYLSRDWDPAWGGGLQLWSNNPQTNKPDQLVRTVDVKFNRAVVFDTTQHSWHGFAGKLQCPEGTYRKSLAIYYVQKPDLSKEDRYRALYAPSKEQENDPEVLELIEKRKNIQR
jgi:hypothetical protein